MGHSLDGPNGGAGLTQRRPAASNLPAFELPPPSNLQFAAQQLSHKFPPLSGPGQIQAPSAAVSVGNLLTPPSNSTSESGASSGNLPNGMNHPHHGMPVLPYTPTFWPGAGNTPTGFGSGLTPQPWQNGSLFPARSMFSPMAGLTRHDTNSPSAGSALPPPPYEIGVHHFQHGVPLASPTSAGHPSHHHAMNSMMQNGVRPPSQASPISPADGVSKPTQTPSLFSSTPQPPQYGFQTSTPVSQSPHSGPSSAVSPPGQHGSIPQLPPHNQFIKPPYPSYSLPAMPGPVMSNVASPGAQMSMVGNMHAQMLPMQFNSGYAANPHMAFAQARANSPQQPANQDRPFKCDECPQSFNRNHDLKRHKRIHLAVKPFPCTHCDKSFSRKDALKRHILVKGCGKAGSDDNGSGDGAKSESGSEAHDVSMVSVAA